MSCSSIQRSQPQKEKNMGLTHILDAILPGPSIFDDKVTVVDPKTGREYEVDQKDLEEK